MTLKETVSSEPEPGSAVERSQVLRHVRHSWISALGESDCEEAVSDAYVALLDAGIGDRESDNRIGWLKKTAWRFANDIYRRQRRRATDGVGEQIERLPAAAVAPDELVELADVDVRLKEAFRQLPEQLQLALASEFSPELSLEDACERLDCPRSTLMHRRNQARAYLYAAVVAENDRFDEVVMTLMTACLSGAASTEEQRRVRELRARSPYYAARFAELRAIDERLPAIAAPIVATDPTVFERANAAFERVRDTVYGIVSRSPESAETASSPALTGGGGGRIGGAAAGGLSGALSGLGGAKVAVGCLTGAAAAGACVAAVEFGVGLTETRGGDEPKGIERRAEADPEPVRPAHPLPPILPAHDENDGSRGPPQHQPVAPADSQSQEPAPARTEPVAAEVAPASDFGFGADGAATSSNGTPTREPTSSTTSGDSARSSSGGGGSAPAGSDFSFGN